MPACLPYFLTMSADLIWMCTRKNSSFIRMKRGTGTGKGHSGTPLFSAEPKNLMGLHSYKYSGLVRATPRLVGALPRCRDVSAVG